MMIIELFLRLVKLLLEIVFSILGALPSFDTENISIYISDYFSLITSYGLEFVNLLIDLKLALLLAGISYAIAHFEFIYTFIMWIVRKIPFLSMK